MDAVKDFNDFKSVLEKRMYFETVEALEKFFGSTVYAAKWLGIASMTMYNRLRRWPQLNGLVRDNRGKSYLLKQIFAGVDIKLIELDSEVSHSKSRGSIKRLIEAEVEKAKKTYSYRLASPKERAEILARHRSKFEREWAEID